LTYISQWRICRNMPSPLQAVAELPQFIRYAEALGLTEDECKRIVETIAARPLQGDEIRGSGGVRKVRFAGRGKGKSGGYRVMTAYLDRMSRCISSPFSAKESGAILAPRRSRASENLRPGSPGIGAGEEGNEEGCRQDHAGTSRGRRSCPRRKGTRPPASYPARRRCISGPPQDGAVAGGIFTPNRRFHWNVAQLGAGSAHARGAGPRAVGHAFAQS
jgi:hypothetical protein